jgi:hypothetical protein
MKVMRVVLMVIDFEGLGEGGIEDVLQHQRFPNDCISPTVISVESRDIGEWTDDHPMNKRGTAESEFIRLFTEAT